jgi:hypothetical protein
MVSLSRRAVPPQAGQGTLMNDSTASSGDLPVPVIFTFGGSRTGKSFSGTGTMPQFWQ